MYIMPQKLIKRYGLLYTVINTVYTGFVMNKRTSRDQQGFVLLLMSIIVLVIAFIVFTYVRLGSTS